MNRQSSDRIFESFVALLDAVPVGTATVLDHDVNTDRWPDHTPWIAAVYVDPGVRRRGIGQKLVSEATAFVRSRGIDTVYLWTIDRGGWYERLGWELVESYNGDNNLVSCFKFNLSSHSTR
jgi:GNAT superfamily N-acetyltransferase